MSTGPLPQQISRWQICSDAVSLFAHALKMVERLARDAIAARGAFHVVLAGGGTPQPLYHQLRTLNTDWSRWHVYFGDERCLPADDPQRNSAMASAAWLAQVPIPPAQIHAIPVETGAPEAARQYALALAGIDRFDLVLLGLGEDGHTASLFPGQPLGREESGPAVLAVTAAPKPPAQRVTLGAWRLSRSRAVLFLVTGATKRPAVSAWRSGADIPARAIVPESGVDVLADQDSCPP